MKASIFIFEKYFMKFPPESESRLFQMIKDLYTLISRDISRNTFVKSETSCFKWLEI